MASADLREELSCSVCLSVYTDPVTLQCGHNFCLVCITGILDTQDGSGLYSCPECRKRFDVRPSLQRNLELCNIVGCDLSTHSEQGEPGIFCTYCIHSPVPAVKTCLQCEASLCEKHLQKHTKSAEHVLTEPTTFLENTKCSVHNELLKYYCFDDAACICVSCCLVGEHRGHHVEPLNEASEKKKETLRDILEKLMLKREESENRVQSLQDRRREMHDNAADVTERVTALFRDIRERLAVLEKRVLSEISRQEEQVSLKFSHLIQQLEIKNDELSREIHHIEELCNMSDPLAVMREEQKPIVIYRMDSDGDNYINVKLDLASISRILHRELLHLSDILLDLKIKRNFSMLETSDILLDIKTANNWIVVSSDLKSATYTSVDQNRLDGPERFISRQVFSISCFTSGQHYWEVDVSEAKKWLIGVACQSIERRIAGSDSYIGFNEKSWGLSFNPELAALHNNIIKRIDSISPVQSVGIYLDYDGGRLSFYQLCDPIRHLHTFTAIFTEPLYAAFYVFENTCIRIRN
ncbi:E3 ubiquitin/ISG15 ligase TRIM25-like [Rhinophrynus dorsalis]